MDKHLFMHFKAIVSCLTSKVSLTVSMNDHGTNPTTTVQTTGEAGIMANRDDISSQVATPGQWPGRHPGHGITLPASNMIPDKKRIADLDLYLTHLANKALADRYLLPIFGALDKKEGSEASARATRKRLPRVRGRAISTYLGSTKGPDQAMGRLLGSLPCQSVPRDDLTEGRLTPERLLPRTHARVSSILGLPL